MSNEYIIKHCIECEQSEHLSKCEFCENYVCATHSHYFAITEHHITDDQHKVLTLCKECYPTYHYKYHGAEKATT